MVVCSDTAVLFLPFPDSFLHISGGLQGAGRGAILQAAIKILPHLQKLSCSPFPSAIVQPKVTPPQVLPGMRTSLVRGTISLKITFVSHLELPMKPSVSLFFQFFSFVKVGGKIP